MNELDLEDLECQLYSQVYHGAAEEIDETAAHTTENPAPGAPDSPPATTNEMGKQSGRYFGPWSSGARYQNRSSSAKSNNPSGCNRRNVKQATFESKYSKSYNKPRRPPAIEQVVVVSPEKSFVYMNSKEKSKARWKAKMQERVRQKRAQKKQRAKQNSIITLSDSDDDDSCVLIDNNWPLLSVADSDDENIENNENHSKQTIADKIEDAPGEITLKSEPVEALNESLADDVIFVESVATPIEIISIDEENHEKSSNEPASLTSSDNANPRTPRKNKTRQQQNERKELLNTPDSASNDFISNSEVELNQGGFRFNFSLHGSDFHNPGEFLKPAPRNETCETESSSSTTDANSINLMKTAVFNEVDFPRDDIFAENNLESFGNFITPLRNNPVPNVQSSPVKSSDGQSKFVLSPDSSSESDSEESQVDRAREVAPKSRQLPELSPMQTKVDVSFSQLGKKVKKSTNMNSKYDLLNSLDVSAQATTSLKDSGKKKKRNKKKRSAAGAGDNTEEDGNISARIPPETEVGESVGIVEELKRKKRRSSQLENTETSENQSKKKMHSSNTEKNLDSLNEKECSDNSPPVEPDSTTSNTGEANDDEKRDTDQNSTKENVDSEEKQMKVATPEKHPQETANEISKENLDVDEKVKAGSPPLEKADANSILDGFAIIDETFDKESSVVVISDSESVLSPLTDRVDIQLNFENSEDWHVSDARPTSTSEPNKKGLDNCSVKDLQMDMSNDPDLWTILDSDRNPSGKSRGRRCNRCKQFGHIGIRCTNKVEVKCTLCGCSGHYEPRCPNKICTQCGQRSPYSTTYCGSCFKLRKSRCRICSMPGHLPNTCPDLWRRYHLTTDEGPPVPYDGPPLKDDSQLWCSGCAQPGHLEHSCRFYKSIYPPTDPFIKSYVDVYKKRPESREPREERSMEQWAPRNRPLLPTPPLHPHAPMLRIPPFLQAQHVPSQISNYRINQLNDPMYSSFDDRSAPMGGNFDQNDFRQMNFANPFHDRVFVANQQNFFPPGAANLVQYPENSQQENFAGNPVNFENVLPDYITLEPEVGISNDRGYEVVEEPPYDGPYPGSEKPCISKINRRRNAMFFSSTAPELQHFLKVELSRLSKFSVSTNKHIRELKKFRMRKRCGALKPTYFERVNMLLFGVLNMLDGKAHLERLKRFKLQKYNSRVDNGTRSRLYNSYCYIFGRERIRGVPYHELLDTI